MSPRAILFAFLICAAGCAENGDETSDFPDEADLPELPTGDTVGPARREADAALRVIAAAPLNATGAADSVVGSVRVLETRIDDSAGLQLTLEISALPPGRHAWHLHAGPCTGAADVRVPLGDASSGRPLEVREGGIGEGSVYLPAEMLPRTDIGTGQLSLRVHERPDGGPAIACADL